MTTYLSAALCILLGLQTAATQPVDRVAVLAPFVGEWSIDGHWEDGAPIHARNVCGWALDKHHLAEQTFLTDQDGHEHQRYQTFMSFDADLGCLVSTSFCVDGSISRYRVDADDDGKTFRFGAAPLDSKKPSSVRQVITFKADDTYTWVVEIADAGGWKRIMNGTWTRVRDAEAREVKDGQRRSR